MPFLPSLLGLILGITFACYSKMDLGFYFFWQIVSFAFLFLFAKIFLRQAPHWFLIMQVVCFFWTGCLIFKMHDFANDVLFQNLKNAQQKIIVATVDDVSFYPQNRYRFKVFLNLSSEGSSFLGRHLVLFLRKDFMQVGDRVVLRDVGIKSSKIMDLKDGCLGTIFYRPKKTKLSVYSGQQLSFKQQLNVFKKKLSTKIMSKLTLLTQSFYGLIFLGYRQKEVAVSLRDSFQNWGVSHQLARSGLHLTMFAYFGFFIFMLMPLGLFWRLLSALVVTLIYYALTYSSISFLRAEMMFVLSILAKIFSEQSSQMHFWSIAAMIILSFNPYQVFALDFQLSFALVFGLLFISQKMLERESGLEKN